VLNRNPVKIGDKVLIAGTVVGEVRGVHIIDFPGVGDAEVRLDWMAHAENWKAAEPIQPTWGEAVAADIQDLEVDPTPTPAPFILDGTPFQDAEQAVSVTLGSHASHLRFMGLEEATLLAHAADLDLQIKSDAILRPHAREFSQLLLDRVSMQLVLGEDRRLYGLA
jgi:hypothetical protein